MKPKTITSNPWLKFLSVFSRTKHRTSTKIPWFFSGNVWNTYIGIVCKYMFVFSILAMICMYIIWWLVFGDYCILSTDNFATCYDHRTRNVQYFTELPSIQHGPRHFLFLQLQWSQTTNGAMSGWDQRGFHGKKTMLRRWAPVDEVLSEIFPAAILSRQTPSWWCFHVRFEVATENRNM